MKTLYLICILIIPLIAKANVYKFSDSCLASKVSLMIQSVELEGVGFEEAIKNEEFDRHYIDALDGYYRIILAYLEAGGDFDETFVNNFISKSYKNNEYGVDAWGLVDKNTNTNNIYLKNIYKVDGSYFIIYSINDEVTFANVVKEDGVFRLTNMILRGGPFLHAITLTYNCGVKSGGYVGDMSQKFNTVIPLKRSLDGIGRGNNLNNLLAVSPLLLINTWEHPLSFDRSNGYEVNEIVDEVLNFAKAASDLLDASNELYIDTWSDEDKAWISRWFGQSNMRSTMRNRYVVLSDHDLASVVQICNNVYAFYFINNHDVRVLYFIHSADVVRQLGRGGMDTNLRMMLEDESVKRVIRMKALGSQLIGS